MHKGVFIPIHSHGEFQQPSDTGSLSRLEIIVSHADSKSITEAVCPVLE